MRTLVGVDKDGNDVWADDLEAQSWIAKLFPRDERWYGAGHTCERETLDGADRCPHPMHLNLGGARELHCAACWEAWLYDEPMPHGTGEGTETG